MRSSSKGASACIKSSILSLSSRVALLSNATAKLCSHEDIALLRASRRAQSCPAQWAAPAVARVFASLPPDRVPHSPSTVTEVEDDPASGAASSNLFLGPLSEKIPRPEGESGRPGRGGYTLQVQLGWHITVFLAVKKFVYCSIEKHLDTTKCRSRQTATAIESVKREALSAFPHLGDYTSCWPVEDIIRARLKYTSSKARSLQRMQQGNM